MQRWQKTMMGLALAAGLSTGIFAEAGAAETAAADGLDAKERAVVAMAATTATGDLANLEKYLTAGLDAGLTVNEIKEVLVQLYAYTGFPRSLNAINRFMAVTKARADAGIQDELGREPSPVPADLDKDEYGAKVRAKLGGRTEIPAPSGYQVFAPAIDTFLKEHLFCDIFIRDKLDPKSRELATVGALGAMTGTEGQLVFHLNAAMNTGSSEAEMREYLTVLSEAAGAERAAATEAVLAKVLSDRAKKAGR